MPAEVCFYGRVDRCFVRQLEDFWGLIDAARGALALRDLGLRRQRQPHVDTVFLALHHVGLQPRWPTPAATLDALRRRTRTLAWSTRDFADRLGISVRSAERLLAGDHTPTFAVVIRWAALAGEPFFVDRPLRPPDITPATEAAADPDRAVPTPSPTTGAATAADRSGPGPAAATRTTRTADIDGPPPAGEIGRATDPATSADTDGPRSAHGHASATGAARGGDRLGHDDTSGAPAPPRHRTVHMSFEACPEDLDIGGQADAPTGTPPPAAPRTSGHDDDDLGQASDGVDAAPLDLDPIDDAARNQGLHRPSEPQQADPVMATVEWRRGNEVLFRGEVARDDVRQTLRLLAKNPSYAGATPFVDGKALRKKRRDSAEDLGATIGAQIAREFANHLRPLIHEQRALAERQEAVERKLAAADSLAQGIQDLKALVAPAQPASFLSLFASALLEELGPKEDPK